MTFLLSKILWIVFNTFNIILFLIVLAFFLKFFRFNFFSKFFYLISVIVFLITGILPTGSYLIFQLEKDFYNENIFPENIDGILILSGATNPFLTKVHNQVSLNASSERLIESVNLMNKYPKAKVIFSGGSGSLKHLELTHSSAAKIFYKSLGVDISNIYFENKSRNTYENIIFSKKIAKPNDNEKWIIITSAFHLKRALNIGQKVNWNLIPYATDFYLPKNFEWHLSFSFLNNLLMFQTSSHEWIGLISYYFMGRTSKIF